ncbi:MAG: GNAT family N-acetyltransferase, partial [Nocardioidaceae bacterium]
MHAVQQPDAFHLRPVEPSDSAELFRIHLASMAAYLAEAFGEWSEVADREPHEKWMQDGRAQVIMIGDRAAGSLEVVRDDNALWLRRIELDPRLHGRGLGSAIVRDIQHQACDQGLRVALDVFPHNPARR